MDTIEKYSRYVTTRMVSHLEPVVVDRAHGAVIQAADGKEYIDCFAGIAVVNAGHVCAAAIANIEVLQGERLVERSAELGTWLMTRLRELSEHEPLIGEVRGKGLMIGVELVRDRRSKEPASEEAFAVRERCREAGVLIGVGGQAGNVLRLQPPLVVSGEQLATTLEVLRTALRRVSPSEVMSSGSA